MNPSHQYHSIRLAAKLDDCVLAPYRATSMLGRCGLVLELFTSGSLRMLSMRRVHHKKLWCFLLCASLLFPSSGFCIKGRDVAMALTGTIVVGAGITFVIKSAKKPSEPTVSLEMKPWLPINNWKQNELTIRP
jgi:hypothetical protein